MMTINTGNYSLVQNAAVTEGPKRLPQSWVAPTGETYSNINNTEVWSDAQLVAILWYPTTINTLSYDPATQKLGDYQFQINIDNVVAEREVIDLTQTEIDKRKDTTLSDTQQTAADLASQTEATLRQNTDRTNVGAAPLIPATDVDDTEVYLKSLYDAMDDAANPVNDPPGAIRQIVSVPGENRDRGVVTRIEEETGGWTYYGLKYTLYTTEDITGQSFKVHDKNETYLGAFTLVEESPGIWTAQTSLIGALTTLQDLHYELWWGQALTQRRKILSTEQEQVFDLRYSGANAGTVGHG